MNEHAIARAKALEEISALEIPDSYEVIMSPRNDLWDAYILFDNSTWLLFDSYRVVNDVAWGEF